MKRIGRHVAKAVRRSPKLPALKTSQISTNGAFRFRSKHCFLNAANQWLQMIRECGREFAPHLWLEHICKKEKEKRSDKQAKNDNSNKYIKKTKASEQQWETKTTTTSSRRKLAKSPLHKNSCFQAKSYVPGTAGSTPIKISGTYDPWHTGDNKHPYKNPRAKMAPGTYGPTWTEKPILKYLGHRWSHLGEKKHP